MKMLVFSVISRDSHHSLSICLSVSSLVVRTRIFLLVIVFFFFFFFLFSFSDSSCFVLFTQSHQHCSRRMTTNNNHKNKSLSLPSRILSFNHHHFVSFAFTVSPISEVTSITTTIFS